MALTAEGAEMSFGDECDQAELGDVQLAEWMDLGETGVGAAGATVPPLGTLHHTGNLLARHY